MNKPLDPISEHIKKEEAKRILRATFPTIATVHDIHEGPNRHERRAMKKGK
jgi:hypothetical protein